MTTRVATRWIDVDTHFYPLIDYKTLRAYLPRGLVAQAQDMLVRDARRAAEPDRVAAETTGAAPLSQRGADPHRDPEARAAAVAQTGFDMQVLIPDALFANLYGASPSGGDLSLPLRTALCQLYNDAVANAQRRYPDRFLGAATVPFDDLEASILETRRAVRELGLRAVLIPGNWLGHNFDTLELYPFWSALHDLDITFFVHHIPQGCRGRTSIDHQPRYPMLGMERMRRLHVGTYLGFGFEYIMACAALTLGGVLDEFPHLRFCFFEAGASWLPYAMYGADRSFEIEPQCARTATRPSQLIQQHCLTAVEPTEHLEQLVAALGSELFFFGTDFPHPEFQRYHNTAAAILDRPGLSEEAKANILGNNIARFLRLGCTSSVERGALTYEETGHTDAEPST
jgi:aminocarboxymuconate-semialdehyde decarboxylase